MGKNFSVMNFNEISDNRGKLIALEECRTVPFEIKRVYYLYDLNKAQQRGFHAHKKLKQLMICLHGQCKVRVTDGKDDEIIVLDTPNQAIFLNNNVWREMFDFEDDCVLMVLASEFYEESDYIRDYEQFLNCVEAL